MKEPGPTHRLYVDEVGNPGFKAGTDPNQRYLSLTGVIIALDEERNTLANAGRMPRCQPPAPPGLQSDRGYLCDMAWGELIA